MWKQKFVQNKGLVKKKIDKFELFDAAKNWCDNFLLVKGLG